MKKVLFWTVYNILAYCTVVSVSVNPLMLTGVSGMNTAMAHNIVGMLNAGLSVYTIVAMFASLNVIGVGVLFAAKSMLGRLTTGAVIAW